MVGAGATTLGECHGSDAASPGRQGGLTVIGASTIFTRSWRLV